MINYVIIIVAVVFFTLQFAITKIFEQKVPATLCTSLIMVAVSNLFGALTYLIIGSFKVNFSTVSIILALAMAGVIIPYYVLGIKVLSLGNLAIYSMFMMLGGMLVPFFYGILFLKETISLAKILGTILLTAFIILQMFSTPAEENKNNGKKYLFYVFCLLAFFINGMTGVITKAHSINENAVDEISFTVISCILTTVLSLVVLILGGAKGTKREQVKAVFSPFSFFIMAALGIATYTGNFLHLKAAVFVPASVQFPLVSGGVIILSTLTSKFFFQEKISVKEWISVAGAFISTVLFAF